MSKCRSQWPSGLRRGSTADRLLGLRVRIPPEAWMSVCCGCCVWSGRGLCDGPIARPEESYRLWCVIVWSTNLENEAALVSVGQLRNRKSMLNERNLTTETGGITRTGRDRSNRRRNCFSASLSTTNPIYITHGIYCKYGERTCVFSTSLIMKTCLQKYTSDVHDN